MINRNNNSFGKLLQLAKKSTFIGVVGVAVMGSAGSPFIVMDTSLPDYKYAADCPLCAARRLDH